MLCITCDKELDNFDRTEYGVEARPLQKFQFSLPLWIYGLHTNLYNVHIEE
jgi:hypothetical protein